MVFYFYCGLETLHNILIFTPLFKAEKIIKRNYSKKSIKEIFPFIDVNKLEKGKLFVYHSDKQSLAYVFDNAVQTAKELTPKRVAHLSNLDLSKNKNLQHIRRVINKGILTETEKGKFYIFENPNLSYCLSLTI